MSKQSWTLRPPRKPWFDLIVGVARARVRPRARHHPLSRPRVQREHSPSHRFHPPSARSRVAHRARAPEHPPPRAEGSLTPTRPSPSRRSRRAARVVAHLGRPRALNDSIIFHDARSLASLARRARTRNAGRRAPRDAASATRDRATPPTRARPTTGRDVTRDDRGAPRVAMGRDHARVRDA